MIFDQMMLIGSSAATKIDLRATFPIMESFFGNKFDETCRKIRNVLIDSCNAASKSQLQSLAAKLDTIALLESPRKTPRKCWAHIAGLFTKKLAANFSKPSGLANMHTNYALWQTRCYRIFLYSTGERFFFHGQNALIAYLEFDN